MAIVILDSSVTIAWFMPDEDTANSRAVLNQVIEDGAIVPIHWQIEVETLCWSQCAGAGFRQKTARRLGTVESG